MIPPSSISLSLSSSELARECTKCRDNGIISRALPFTGIQPVASHGRWPVLSRGELLWSLCNAWEMSRSENWSATVSGNSPRILPYPISMTQVSISMGLCRCDAYWFSRRYRTPPAWYCRCAGYRFPLLPFPFLLGALFAYWFTRGYCRCAA